MAGGPSGSGWRGKRGGKANPSNPNWRKAAPASAAGGSSRTVKLLALGGCAVAVAVCTVVMIRLIDSPQRAGLVAVAGDPAAAGRLDVPYDPAGWLSAARLLDAVKSNPDAKAIGPVSGGDRPFALDEDGWLNAIRQDVKADPVVVYVGLVGGVNRQAEAVLHTGRADRKPVRVAEVVKRLVDAAGAKRVVLVLDVGRQLPDPNLGEVAPDFARAVRDDKALNDDLAKAKTLALILATGDESRAWDSPDHGLTMLATNLRSGLLGGAGRAGYESFGVSDLMKSLEAEVERMSTNQRPTAQKPVLLPAAEWAEGGERERAFAKQPFYKPPAREFDAAPAAPLEAPPKLKEYWDDAQKLARPDDRPPPWVDTPAAWRRYRELGLRLEQAFVAGDLEGQAVLEAAIKVEAERVAAGSGVRLQKSGRHALPLDAALGRKAATNLGPAVRGAASLADLAKALGDSAALNVRPPTEAHLPRMLHHYATSFGTPAVAPKLDDWRPAALCRLAAEQAALSAPEAAKGFPYAERVWPAVRAAVLAADAARRRGEDRLLADGADDRSKPAAQEFAEASAGYQEALGRAGRFQKAFAARDEAFADLPFLTRWATEVEALTDGGDPAALATEVENAWKATHLLAEAVERALRDGNPKALAALDAAAEDARSRAQRVRAAAASEGRVPEAERNKTQTSWLTLQHLAALPVPLLAPADKAANFESARRIAAKLKTAEGQVGDKPPPGAAKETVKVAVPESVKAARRMRGIAASLGSPHGDWAVDRGTATLRETSEATGLASAQRAREAAFADPARPDESEALSRLGVPHRATEEYEPAAANARRRWAVLLDALARRAALDHWFDESSQPYLTKFAQDYLDDAQALRDPAKPAPTSPDAADAVKLIAAANAAAWKYEPAPGDPLTDWTTEKENRFAYRFVLGAYEKLLDAEPVVWAGLSNVKKLTLAEAATRPRLVSWQDDPEARLVTVDAKCEVELEKRDGEVKLTATAYFRGRRVLTEQDINFNGRPHVVQTDLPPPPRAAIAVRADVDPGAVAILIDYSGSMADKWAQGGGKSKREIVVQLLRDLLPKLPAGTRLSLRLMRVDAATRTESRRIFPAAGREEIRGLTPEDFEAILATLDDKANSPDGATPLVSTMELALTDFPPGFNGVKTLIVVTDGADTTRIKAATPNRQEYMEVKDMSAEVKRRLTTLVNGDVVQKFDGVPAAIQMVVFGAGDDELKLASEMFAPIESFETNPGRVIVAKNETSLRNEILEALRPRVKVRAGNVAVKRGKPPNEVPRIGIPADPAAAGDGVLWRGPLEAQNYTLKYLNTSAEVKLGSGDALALRLRKGQGEFKYEFERECYYRDVLGKKPKVAADRAAESATHFAHVSNYGTRNPGSALTHLAAVASVDRVGDSLKPGRDGGALALENPKALWWEVRRTPAGAKDEVRYDKALSVWNAFGLAAPSWRLVADGVRDSAELTKGVPFRLAVWPLELPPLLDRVAFSNTDLEGGAAKTVSGVRVRARLEDIRVLGSNYPGPAEPTAFPPALTAKPLRCLVLRIDDPAGRLLRAKVSWENNAAIAARQHLYYFRDPTQVADKAKVKAYTVIVGPVTEDFVTTERGAEVELLDLGESLRQVPSRRLDLDLGRPTDDDRGLDTLPFSLNPQPSP